MQVSTTTLKHLFKPAHISLQSDDEERALHQRILSLYDLIQEKTMSNLLLKKQNDDLELQIRTIDQIREQYQRSFKSKIQQKGRGQQNGRFQKEKLNTQGCCIQKGRAGHQLRRQNSIQILQSDERSGIYQNIDLYSDLYLQQMETERFNQQLSMRLNQRHNQHQSQPNTSLKLNQYPPDHNSQNVFIDRSALQSYQIPTINISADKHQPTNQYSFYQPQLFSIRDDYPDQPVSAGEYKEQSHRHRVPTQERYRPDTHYQQKTMKSVHNDRYQQFGEPHWQRKCNPYNKNVPQKQEYKSSKTIPKSPRNIEHSYKNGVGSSGIINRSWNNFKSSKVDNSTRRQTFLSPRNSVRSGNRNCTKKLGMYKSIEDLWKNA